MDRRDWIIDYMSAVAAALADSYGIDRSYYFDELDEREIERWRLSVAEYVWQKLRSNIVLKQNEEVKITGSSHPFCIHNLSGNYSLHCKTCSYGKRHGICDHDDSNMMSIAIALDSDENKITPKFFEKIFLKIEMECRRRFMENETE